jgi:hypothetical protein
VKTIKAVSVREVRQWNSDASETVAAVEAVKAIIVVSVKLWLQLVRATQGSSRNRREVVGVIPIRAFMAGALA